MDDRSGEQRARSRVRATALAVVLIGHALLIAVVIVGSPRRVSAVVPQPPLAIFDLPAPTPSVPAAKPAAALPDLHPAPPVPIVPPPPTVLTPPSPAVIALLATANAAAAGCDLADPVRAALAESVAVQAGLPRIPAAGRSVANAIMIWDGHWAVPGPLLDAIALAALRDVVAGVVAAASPACRDQPQAGPRLLALSFAGTTTVIVLGSGQWRWQNVLDTALPPTPDSEHP